MADMKDKLAWRVANSCHQLFIAWYITAVGSTLWRRNYYYYYFFNFSTSCI